MARIFMNVQNPLNLRNNVVNGVNAKRNSPPSQLKSKMSSIVSSSTVASYVATAQPVSQTKSKFVSGLYAPMVSRIASIKPGCGSCGH